MQIQTLQSAGDRAGDQAIRELGPWFHNLHLPDGRQTAPDHPLGDFPRQKWQRLETHVAQDLSGAEVLDIGCNAGFYSFELARRGARVTAIDSDPHYLRQARWAAGQLGLKDQVFFERRSVYEIGHWRKRFDLIWFCGVFYHLRYPLLALDLVARASRRTVMFQSLHLNGPIVETLPPELGYKQRDRMREPHWPAMAFIEHSYAGDPTNWWVPNSAALVSLTRSAGLRLVSQVTPDTLILEVTDAPERDEWLAAVEGALAGAER